MYAQVRLPERSMELVRFCGCNSWVSALVLFYVMHWHFVGGHCCRKTSSQQKWHSFNFQSVCGIWEYTNQTLISLAFGKVVFMFEWHPLLLRCRHQYMSPEDRTIRELKQKRFCMSDATESETFFFVLCVNTTKFALLRDFILIKTICLKLWQSHCTQMQKVSFWLTHVCKNVLTWGP